MAIKTVLEEITEMGSGVYRATVPDRNPTHPRKDCSLITTIQTWNDEHEISDRNQYDTPGEFILGIMLDEPFESILLNNIPPETRGWEQVPAELREMTNEMGGYPGAIGNIRLDKFPPVYNRNIKQRIPYLSLSLEPFSDVLEQGQVGWIHINPERMEEFNMPRERATKIMAHHLQELQDHINRTGQITILMRKIETTGQMSESDDRTIYMSNQKTKRTTRRKASPAGV